MVATTATAPALRRIVVIGASADGIAAIKQIVHQLPADFAAPVIIVQHVGPLSQLPRVLTRTGRLPVLHPFDGERIYPGRVYVAPSDRHVRIDGDTIRLDADEEGRHCPSIDVLFRSAAEAHGPKVIGVVLTGYLHDGAEGLRTIKQRGGISIVQDPGDAGVPDMPRAAAARAPIDHQCKLGEIAPLLVRLVAS